MATTFEQVVVSFLGQDTTLGPLLTQLSTKFQAAGMSATNATALASNFGKVLAGAVVAGAGIAILAADFMFLSSAISAAVDQQTKYTKLAVDLGRTGSETNAVIAEWEPTINGISDATGRLNSDIMTMVDKFALAGISNKEMMTSLTETSAAIAFQSGKSTEDISTLFSKAIESGKLMPKTLSSIGLSLADLGLTSSKQFEALSKDERAALLAHAGTLDKFKNANDAYKNTFEGMINRIKIAWEDFQVRIGRIVLPIITPWLEGIAGALEFVLGLFEGLPAPIQTILLALPILAGVLLVVLGIMIMLAPGIEAVGIMMGLTAGTFGIYEVAAALAAGATGLLSSAFTALFVTSPVGWIILIIVAIIAIITYFNAWGAIINWFKGVWAAAVSLVLPLINALQIAFGEIWHAISKGIEGAWSVIKPALDQLTSAMGGTGGGADILGIAFKGLQFIIKLLTTAVQFIAPIIGFVLYWAIRVLAVVIVLVINYIKMWIDILKAVWGALLVLWGYLVQFGKDVYNIFKSVYDAAVSFLQPVIQFWTDVQNAIQGAIDKLKTFVANQQAQANQGTNPLQGQSDWLRGQLGITYGGRPAAGGPGGTTTGTGAAGGESRVVHHHNETITIDASQFTESQLKGLLIDIYEGITR